MASGAGRVDFSRALMRGTALCLLVLAPAVAAQNASSEKPRPKSVNPAKIAAPSRPSDPQPTSPDVSKDALLAGFVSPPNVAKPRAWWHWMNGNVTKEGIVADLQWMNRVGIGGAHYFDAGGPIAGFSFIQPRLVVGDANWREAINLAVRTADGLGMEMTTAASPGWSETGGPWVTAEQAQKKYVWSESIVEGSRAFRGKLPLPPAVTGSFQDAGPREKGPAAKPDPEYYRDAMVIAYRMPVPEAADVAPVALSSSSGPLVAETLRDGKVANGQAIVGPADKSPGWIQAEFAKPVTIRGLSIGIAGDAFDDNAPPILDVSDDGKSWRRGAVLAGPTDALLKSYGFSALTARYFRLQIPRKAPTSLFPGAPAPTSSGPAKFSVSEFVLHTGATVDRFVEKAGFSDPIPYDAAPTFGVDPRSVIKLGDVVDLTAKMTADGTLDWVAPKGRWRVIRLGYSLTGQHNGPAPVEATGLEVDKFSRKHITSYLDQYLGRFEAATGKELMGRRGLQYLLSDSWEAGVQNWTDDMAKEFKARRGYDLAPWIPVLTGHVVESAAASDAFLWDWRRTLEDLLAEHYRILHEELKKRGMGYYAEAQGDTWRAIGDGLEMKSRADIPMAEYWYESFFAGPGQASLKADMKEAASAAHLYGRPLVANESLTVFAGPRAWSYSPSMLKPVVDEIFAYGINRFVLHTSVHQPTAQAPGLSLGPIGQYINRNETWAEQAGPFFAYIGRASWLLQQGTYVADVAYFYGEERPPVYTFKGANAFDAAHDRLNIEVPNGIGYDFINAETLRTVTSADAKGIMTTAGMRYRVLFMPRSVEAMSFATLDGLARLVANGAVLVGGKPKRMLGLSGDASKFDLLVARLWGSDTGPRTVGKGRVYPSQTLTEVLAAEGIAPDVSFSVGGERMLQLHRRTDDGRDIFYLVNRNDGAISTEASFRVTDAIPALWRADTGTVEPLSYRIEGGRMVVPLRLNAKDSAFVIFTPGPVREGVVVDPPVETALTTLSGPWKVTFQPGRGAPAAVTLPQLMSWPNATEDGVRYFSGTGTYHVKFAVPAGWSRPGRRITLDLGDVRDVASITINGRALGTVWKSPYMVDVTDWVHPGTNVAEFAVTNLWFNRLVGDAIARKAGQPTYAWTIDNLPRSQQGGGFRVPVPASAALLPSGLLGPVRLIAIDQAGPPTK